MLKNVVIKCKVNPRKRKNTLSLVGTGVQRLTILWDFLCPERVCLRMTNYTPCFDKRKDQILTESHSRMIEVFIRLQSKYETVNPSYEKLAHAANICKRKAQYIVKDLVAWDILIKVPQYIPLANGTRRQTTNAYELKTGELNGYPQEPAPHTDNDRAPQKILSSSSLSDKPLEKEEYKDAHVTHEIFVKGMKRTWIPEILYKLTLRNLGDLASYSIVAFENALEVAKRRYHSRNVKHFPNWFTEVLKTENLVIKHYNELLNTIKQKPKQEGIYNFL